MKKGWLGLRKLKVFLRNLNKRKSNFINKADFKYFFTNFGIFLTNKEVDVIYEVFDNERKNEINFIEFLNNIRQFVNVPGTSLNQNDLRRENVERLLSQLKLNKDKISFKDIESITKFDFHPEVTLLFF